jgi:hypothetical protein
MFFSTKATPAQPVADFDRGEYNEDEATVSSERFFKAIKNITIDGHHLQNWYSSRSYGTRGNTYLKEFKGCTHPEHQK